MAVVDLLGFSAEASMSFFVRLAGDSVVPWVFLVDPVSVSATVVGYTV